MQKPAKGFDWENTSTLKVEDRRFDRKVREALEIQFRETSPRNEHGLNQDDGQYVTTYHCYLTFGRSHYIDLADVNITF